MPRPVVAAVCYRTGESGTEFLLVRTKDGRCRTFPRGHVEAGERLSQAAEREAGEEAGAAGRIAERPFTSYIAAKDGQEETVPTFLMFVTSRDTAHELNRDPRWFSAESAVTALAQGREPRYAREQTRVVHEALSAIASAGSSEYGHLTQVAMQHPRDVFTEARLDADWQRLRFAARPDRKRAIDEFDRFVEILRSHGCTVHLLPADLDSTLDAIYARDASVVSPRGPILCNMGKQERTAEPSVHRRALESLGLPIAGAITAPGTLEGGDVVWFDDRTVAVGRGYRTNAAGIRQFRDLLGDGVTVLEVPLPHWHGETDVMHLMSLVSPIDRDAAVVYARLLPVPFREWLLDRDIALIEVPDAEFETMGGNVLALGPRRAVVLRGNPLTRAALDHAQVEVTEYDGAEISLKGAGGPTCLTRPLERH